MSKCCKYILRIIYDISREREFNIRSALVVLDYNHGVGRLQAEDKDGNLLYKLNVILYFSCIVYKIFLNVHREIDLVKILLQRRFERNI